MRKGMLFGFVSAQVFVSFTLNPLAKADIGGNVEQNLNAASAANASQIATQATQLQVGESYRMSKARLLNFESENEEGKTSTGTTILPADTEITILKLDNERGLITIGLDTEEEDNLPSQMTLSLDELLQTDLVEISKDEYATGKELEQEGPEELAYFEVLVPTDVAGTHWRAHRVRRKGRKTPSCFRDVKKKLLAMGKVRSYPPGAAAYQGYSVLTKQYGFRPVKFSQRLPYGAVCISEGGRWKCGKQKCGHIAVHTPQGWYGAGVFPTPLLRGHYNLRCVQKN